MSSSQAAEGTRPRNLINNKWESIIGLEIHAQIKSKTKLFSGRVTKDATVAQD